MDRRGKQARQHHEAAARAEGDANKHRAIRDRLVRELSADGYGYETIARMVGVSKPLIRLIVKRDAEDGGREGSVRY